MSDIAKEKEEVKKILRSLLISAPSGLQPNVLERDYFNVTNEPVPYKKFGFSTSMEFFRSMPDVIYLSMQRGRTVLYGKADQYTQKILNMVQGQKRNTKSKGNLSSPAVPRSGPRNGGRQRQPLRSSPSVPSSSLRNKIYKLLSVHKYGFHVSDFERLYKEVNGTAANLSGFTSVIDVALKMTDIVRLEYGDKRRDGNNVYLYPYDSSSSSKSAKHNTSDTRFYSAASNKEYQPNHQTGRAAKFRDLRRSTNKNTNLNCSLKRDSNGSLLNVSKKYKSPEKAENKDTKKTVPLKSSASGYGSDRMEQPVFSKCTPKVNFLQKRCLEILERYNAGLLCSKLPEVYEQEYKEELDITSIGYFSIIDFIASITDQINVKRLKPTGDWLLCLRKFQQEQLISKQQATNAPVNVVPTQKIKWLHVLKEKVCELLERFPTGILCDAFCDVYAMQFKQQLNFKELGYCCVEKVILKMSDIILLDSEDGQCIIKPRLSSELPDSVANFMPCPDAVGSGISYDPPNMPSLDGDYFDAVVSHVVSPGYFIIQLVGPMTTGLLAKLMDELEVEYGRPDASQYQMPVGMIKKGQVCVAIYHGDMSWNRGLITKSAENGYAEVLFVDYGDKLSVPVKAIYSLKGKFLNCLPAQMIEARLSHLQPANSKYWTPKSRQEMLNLCRNKDLVAQVTNVGELLSLYLCDTSQSETEDFYINEQLVDLGHAVFRHDDCPSSPQKKFTDESDSSVNSTLIGTRTSPIANGRKSIDTGRAVAEGRRIIRQQQTSTFAQGDASISMQMMEKSSSYKTENFNQKINQLTESLSQQSIRDINTISTKTSSSSVANCSSFEGNVLSIGRGRRFTQSHLNQLKPGFKKIIR